jgi:predicted nucleotide-binding protein (sugar kinase/HSP70/actin superfamily)
VSHGHVLNVLEKGVKKIFLPSIVNLKPSHPEIPNTSACPYAQSFPYAIPSSIDFKKNDVKLLQPILHFGFGKEYLEKELVEFGKSLHRASKRVKKALEKAERFQALFINPCSIVGKKF